MTAVVLVTLVAVSAPTLTRLVTFNAPKEAFDDPTQEFFGGKSVDDLLWPAHLNFRFFGMSPLGTFSCHDVMKNPDVENDFRKFEAHLDKLFPAVLANA